MSPSSVVRGEPDYPPLLADLPRAPGLRVLGRLPEAAGVAIVGTRGASPGAYGFARALAGACVRRGLSVWSGGAAGIDGAAHEGALDAGGPTVVVLGGGLGQLYPPEHAELFDAVVTGGGALVSLFADDEHPTPPRFHARNAILAAATLVTIVVQAPRKSGARSTARHARRLGRPVGVVAHPPWDTLGAGCFDELTLGARVVCDVDDVLALVEQARSARARRALDVHRGQLADAVSIPAASASEAARAASEHEFEPSAAVAHVLAALEKTPLHVDDLCETTHLPPARVAEALLTLTLQAVVVEGPAGLWRRKFGK